MRLKAITAAFLVSVVVLLVASAPILGPVPQQGAPRAVKRNYGVRTLCYLGALLFTLSGSGIGAYLVLRRAKEEYRQASLDNLKTLLEGAAKDVSNQDDEPHSV